MKNEIEILSTRELDPALTERAGIKGIRIDISPFIRTEAVDSMDVQQEIAVAETMKATVVFSSANAVEAVASFATEGLPVWDIFCVGGKTADRAGSCFPSSHIAGKEDSAAELAGKILEESEADEVLFFCGDQRRDELPDILRDGGIEVNEIIVYRTVAIPHKIGKNYDGVMFYSPSGVKSFFSCNTLPPDIPLFAIGNTTATAIRNICSNPVLIPGHPARESLVDEVIDYYS